MIIIRFFRKLIVLVLSMLYADFVFCDPAFLESPEEEQEQGNAGNTPKEQFCNAGYTIIKTGAICLGAISGVTLAIYLVTCNKRLFCEV